MKAHLSDAPYLFTALAQWLACLVYILKYPRRISGPRLWGLLAGGLVIQCLFLELSLAHLRQTVLWLPCVLLAVGLMFGLVAACCDMPLSGAAYITVRAFLLAEFAASLEWQLYSRTLYYLGWQEEAGGRRILLGLATMAAVYALVFQLVAWLERRLGEPRAVMGFQFRELWAPVLMGTACFLMSNLSFEYSVVPFTDAILAEINNVRTLVDLAGVTVLYAYHIQRSEMFMQRELDSIQSVMEHQYAQYCRAQESVEVINHKYHDLRHQLAQLRLESDAGLREACLEGLEEELRDYEVLNRTGHLVLDTVLTGRSLYCDRHGVELTCAADGARLDFMDEMDICAIFGSILDNAIECELGVKERQKRQVRLEVFAQEDAVVIHCKNYCPELPAFQDGLPVSKKGGGYGLKSVQLAASKYGGAAVVRTGDDWFEVSVTLPTSQRKNAR